MNKKFIVKLEHTVKRKYFYVIFLDGYSTSYTWSQLGYKGKSSKLNKLKSDICSNLISKSHWYPDLRIFNLKPLEIEKI